jgi:hypothetical protein
VASSMNSTDVLSGEAWEGGPLIISWRDVQMAGDGYNVVIHEFAHKLDMLNGEADGIPALHSGIAEAELDRRIFRRLRRFLPARRQRRRNGHRPLRQRLTRPNFSPCCRNAFLSCQRWSTVNIRPSTRYSNATTVRIPLG